MPCPAPSVCTPLRHRGARWGVGVGGWVGWGDGGPADADYTYEYMCAAIDDPGHMPALWLPRCRHRPHLCVTGMGSC